jgi:NADH-quinone oxidoreductase subunit G
LLDKDFLFERRVWELNGTKSVCPGCSTGCSIRVDHCDNKVYRLKPRFNPQVNDWWMCDEGRFGFKYVGDPKRLTRPIIRRGLAESRLDWTDVPEILRFRFEEHVRENGGASVVGVFSPFMANEEAWLLATFLRDVAPGASLIMGPVPEVGVDDTYPAGAIGKDVRFTISKEKCPNRQGIERLLQEFGDARLDYADFKQQLSTGVFSAAWMVGGYPQGWSDKELAKGVEKLSLLVVQDLFASDLSGQATVVLPSCTWVEREGSFVNGQGLTQSFDRAIDPPHGARRDGQYLFEVAGFEGLYTGARVRALMSASGSAVAGVSEPPLVPAHAH